MMGCVGLDPEIGWKGLVPEREFGGEIGLES